ncbi:hypothetical protein LINPERHAP2_LOCUS16904 [Linum perenne]
MLSTRASMTLFIH